MANPEHLAKLKEGVEAWNAWRAGRPEVIPNLVRAKLVGARLGGANLAGVNFLRAELDGAILAGSILAGANLSETRLYAADLGMTDILDEANLLEANLVGAILADAFLFGANFTGAILDLADLSKAAVGTTTFGDNDLSSVKGLEAVEHVAPSTIGIDTIYRSNILARMWRP